MAYGIINITGGNSEKSNPTYTAIEEIDSPNKEIISGRNRKPMITIIDDDGRSTFLSKWEPILQEKYFKIDIAVITGSVGTANFMTWEQIERLKEEYNIDLLNHTHNHLHLAEQTETIVREEFETSSQILKARGHRYDVVVPPYGSTSATVRQVAREYCRAAVHIEYPINIKINVPPLYTFQLPRVSLMPSSGEMGSVETYTAYIDDAIENNGWLIFMTHSQYASFDTEKVRAVIDYANASGIKWVSTREGLDRIGNLIDTGDYIGSGAEYYILDADGAVHSKSYGIQYRVENTNFDFYTPITAFQQNFTHRTSILLTNPTVSLFPRSTGGTLETYRGSTDSLSFQLYFVYNRNEVYKRRWLTTTSEWGLFELIVNQLEFDVLNGAYTESTLNRYSADTNISEFLNNKVTTFAVNTAGATGFPDNKAGIVTVYKVGGNGWYRQEFRRYMSNELWSRYVDTSGEWTSWVKISAV